MIDTWMPKINAWDIVIAVALQVSKVRFKGVAIEKAIAKAKNAAELENIKW